MLMSSVNSSNNATSATNREYGLDYLRICACFMVVVLHVSAQNFYSFAVDSADWGALNFFDSAARSAVPLFFMISGKLFLSKNELSISRLFGKNISKLFVVYFTWSLLYAVDSIGIRGLFKPEQWLEILDLTINAKFHLWYLPALISVYFLIPVLWSAIKQNEDLILRYICPMFFFFGILRSTLFDLFPSCDLLSTLFGDFTFSLAGYAGYFVFGYALSKYKGFFFNLRIRQLLLLLLATIIVASSCTNAYSIAQGKATTFLYGNFSLPVFFESTLLFLVFSKLSISPRLAQFKFINVEVVSACTFFIYLAHVYFYQHLDLWFGLTTASFPAIISVPFISSLVFFICLSIALLLRRIPLMKKWLM